MGDRSLADWLGEAEADDPHAPVPEREGTTAAPTPGADDDGWDEPVPRRPRRLWLLAVVPWLVVAVALVVLRGDVAAPPLEHDAAPLPQQAEATTGHADAGHGEAADGAPGAGAVPRWSEASPASQVDALAVSAVHLTVTGSDGEADRYVELAAVEHRAQLDEDTVVVTVLAVVLEGSDGAWSGRRPARFAVPLRQAQPEPVVLGPPWPLPTADLEPRAPDGHPVDGSAVHDAVLGALATAGYDGAEVDELERLDLGGGLLRVAGAAVPPGETSSRPVEVWMTDDPDPRLLGLAPQPANFQEEP